MEIQITITDSNSSAQQQLDELRAERAALLEANRQLSLQVQEQRWRARPALPEGMRIAESEEFGRVVVAPKVSYDGAYYAIVLEPKSVSGIEAFWIPPSDLTFLDEEPEPAPLPKPKDCKEGDLYRAKMDSGGRYEAGVAVRSDPEDPAAPWFFTLDDGNRWWLPDSSITLFARLTPDHDIKEQA